MGFEAAKAGTASIRASRLMLMRDKNFFNSTLSFYVTLCKIASLYHLASLSVYQLVLVLSHKKAGEMDISSH
jgi:NADH:ubiquinone oxidoreductase subunit 6 (subunit J)